MKLFNHIQKVNINSFLISIIQEDESIKKILVTYLIRFIVWLSFEMLNAYQVFPHLINHTVSQMFHLFFVTE